MITTAKATIWPSDVAISDLAAAGLTTACVLRLRFQTLPNPTFLRPLSVLSGFDRLACERALADMLIP